MPALPLPPQDPARRRLSLALGLAAGAVLMGCNAARPVPAVAYTLLDGSAAHTASWQGKVMLVNFWATTCALCVQEMPGIVALHHKFSARGYDTLAVAMRHDPPSRVLQFAAAHDLPFGVAIDNTGVIARHFDDVQLTPTTFLVDRRGMIVERLLGVPDFAALEARIALLLGPA
jgi:peroxiredoxin